MPIRRRADLRRWRKNVEHYGATEVRQIEGGFVLIKRVSTGHRGGEDTLTHS